MMVCYGTFAIIVPYLIQSDLLHGVSVSDTSANVLFYLKFNKTSPK